MQDCYNVMFKLNGVYSGNMIVKEDMMFAELVLNFCKNYNLENPTFYYQGNPIKSDSCRSLRELEIKNLSVIEVETNSFNNNRSNRNEANSFSKNTNQQSSLYNGNSHES